MGRGVRVTSATMILAAFIGAMLSLGFVLLMSHRIHNMSMLVVSGVMIGYICSAVTELVVTFANDAVVIFTTGLPDEVQTGVVTVNIYVPDTDLYGNGVLVEDGQRTEEIERLANDWVNSLTADKSCYKFRLQQTIYTEAEPDINQHFIVVKLHYEFFGSDDAPLNIKSM